MPRTVSSKALSTRSGLHCTARINHVVTGGRIPDADQQQRLSCSSGQVTTPVISRQLGLEGPVARLPKICEELCPGRLGQITPRESKWYPLLPTSAPHASSWSKKRLQALRSPKYRLKLYGYGFANKRFWPILVSWPSKEHHSRSCSIRALGWRPKG